MKWFNKKIFIISVVCSLLLLSSGIVYGEMSISKKITLTSLTLCVSSEGQFRSIKELTGACKPKDSEITLKGEKGAVGPAGPAGSAGPAGPTGPQGVKGDQGILGPIGPAGPQGLKGDSGSNGKTIAGYSSFLFDRITGPIWNGSGNGFTVNWVSVGEYKITFPPGTWNKKPIISITPTKGLDITTGYVPVIPVINSANFDATGSATFDILIYEPNLTLVNANFYFTVVESQ